MEQNDHDRHPRPRRWACWVIGLGSLIWLLLRSGTKPRRLVYPCQQAALANSVGFLGYVASLLGAVHLRRALKCRAAQAGSGLLTATLLLTITSMGTRVPTTLVYARPGALPGWTSPTAISDVFVVTDVPEPECSLDGGALPTTPPCNDPTYALRDAGMDTLITEMETQGEHFYRTASHPDGIIGAGNVVVVKINNQWGGYGDGSGSGRLSTNTDALKGLIWRILQHPDGFTGEVVVAENTQYVNPNWDITPANAQDQDQSYQDVVDAFKSLGYAISLFSLDDLNDDPISGGSIGASGYPSGEYAHGNNADAYILLEDPAGDGADELSYPKFRTAEGSYVSMRYGVWSGSTYEVDRLTFINMPVLKRHGMAGATIAWKNLIGFITIFDTDRRYGDWDAMHDYFWGYTQTNDPDYGLLGRELALIRAPDLNVVDAIWVAFEDNTSGNAARQDVLLASTDPLAVDWYASEHILRPLAAWDAQDTSAARSGTFRSATRANQNAAASVWPGGGYPYIDLLDTYDGDTPSNDEKNQMNVYVVTAGVACRSITGADIVGPTVGFTGTLYTFTAVITPPTATEPITYTWVPTPDSGQGSASAQYAWNTPDTYTLTLTAGNCGADHTAEYAITISDTKFVIYLPLALR